MSFDCIISAAKRAISFFPQTYTLWRGNVAELAPNYLHEKSKTGIGTNISKYPRRLVSFWKSHVVKKDWSWHWQRCKVATFWDRLEVYLWPHRSPNPALRECITQCQRHLQDDDQLTAPSVGRVRFCCVVTWRQLRINFFGMLNYHDIYIGISRKKSFV